jgi:hypothetical protein
MRSMGTRRAALMTGVATVAAAALTGCGTGQQAETANKEPSIYGLNTQNADGSVLVRGLAVTYGTLQGYPAGGNAPLEFGLFNETREPVRVTITSRPPAGAEEGVLSARSVGLSGGATPSAPVPGSGVPSEAEPTGSRPPAQRGNVGDPTPDSQSGQGSAGPSAPATPSLAPTPTEAPLRPAEIALPPLSSLTFRPGDTESVQVVGLSGPLKAGNSVNLVFTFSNGAQPLTVQAPVGVPLSPVPRGSAENEGISEDEGH